MPPLVIRRMRGEELGVVVGVWGRARRDAQPELEARLGHTTDEDLRHFRDVIARECAVWVAVQGDTPLALLAIRGDRIEQLHVEPAAQGRGIGSALLARARRLAPGGLTLFTHRGNTRARSFYEKRGFRAIGFGVSPPPESEPDVKYAWSPE